MRLRTWRPEITFFPASFQLFLRQKMPISIIWTAKNRPSPLPFSYLSRIEQNINDNGFTTRRATEQDLKKMLGVYFEQNVTTEKFEDFDGDRWVIVGE